MDAPRIPQWYVIRNISITVGGFFLAIFVLWRVSAAQPPFDQFALALIDDNVVRASNFVTRADRAAWRASTIALSEQHQGIKSVTRSDWMPPHGGQIVVLTKLTWQDGYDRCLRLREMPNHQIAVQAPGYQGCADLPWPTTPLPASSATP